MRSSVIALVGLLLGSVASSQEDWRQALEATQLDFTQARTVANLKLALHGATLRIEQGTLVPAMAVGGQSREFVFLGNAWLDVEPPNEVEARQLELFTGSRRLREPIIKAVLVVCQDSVSKALTDRALVGQLDPAIAQLANDLFDEWRASGEREILQVEQIQLVDLLGDPAGEDFFAGWFEGKNQGRFLYVYDPWEYEQISLGQFEPLDLTEREERRLSRRIRREQRRKGRFIGLDVSELGIWNSWISVAPQSPDGRALHGSSGFEAEHFVIEVDIAPGDLELSSTARIVLRAQAGQSRVIPLVLARDLEVEAVLDGAGRPLFFDQHDERLVVALPAAPGAGDSIVLECRYGGRIFDTRDQARVLRTSSRWYPNPGEPSDRATFDVRLKWPKRFDVVASGRIVESGIEGDTRLGRWQLSQPVTFFGFELGRFETFETKAGPTRITLALDPQTGREIREDADSLLKTASEALQYFEEILGPYPYDDLAIVTLPRSFSQAAPGLVTLSRWSAFDAVANADVEENYVLAHEIAHQWWGHLVSWQSYRDQWIIEAMANYAAVLFVRNRQSGSRRIPTYGWKSALLAETEDGRTVESLGPLVVGERLRSSYSTRAYFAIVYLKGAVVLDTLARAFGEETFLGVLRKLLKSVAGQAISTEDFITRIERLTGAPITTFAKQFIYNTGLPKVYYDLEVEKVESGQWRIHGEARQQSPCRLEYDLVKTPDGRIDLAHRCVELVDIEQSSLIVPIQAVVYDPLKWGGAANPQRTGNRVSQIHIMLRGRTTMIDFELPLEPKQVWLDARSEVFGQFFSRQGQPKASLYFQAIDLADAGRWDDAERYLHEALAADVVSGPILDREMNEDEVETRRVDLDAQIQRALVRVHLANGRLEAADQAKAAGKKLWLELERRAYPGRPIKPNSAVLLEARLALLKGRPRASLKILNQNKSRSREWYLAYALAACAVGRTAEFEEAVEEAEERGADVSLLDSCH